MTVKRRTAVTAKELARMDYAVWDHLDDLWRHAEQADMKKARGAYDKFHKAVDSLPNYVKIGYIRRQAIRTKDKFYYEDPPLEQTAREDKDYLNELFVSEIVEGERPPDPSDQS